MATPASLIPPDESVSLVSGVLRQTQNRLTRVSLLASACVLLAATGLFVLGFVVADHYLDGGVPPRIRSVLLVFYLAGVAAAVVVMIGLPAARRIGTLYTARLLERAHPTFHNSLVNAIQLEKHRELPGSIRSALLARAAVDAAHADVRRAVASDRLRWAAVVLGAAAALFLGYMIFAPKPVLPSVLRAFGADIPAPTRTVIVDMEPADGACVIIGRPVTFTVRLAGRVPPAAYVHFCSDDGVTVLNGQRLALVPAGPSDGSGRARIWQGTKAGQDVQQNMRWRLTAGDASSAWRRLNVRALPDVVDLRVTCVYPSYTGLAPRATSPGQSADVDAPVGTQVTVEAVTNVPVRDPVLVIGPGADPADETRLSMRHVGLDATRIVGQFTVMQDGQYYLRFVDREGEANQDPIRHTIRARPDRPPTVALIRPAGDLELRPDEALEVCARIEDDYGVSRVAIEYKRGAQAAWVSLPLPTGPDAAPTTRPAARRSLLETTVPLVRFGAIAGDVIEWHLAVWDNRVDLDGRLSPQKGVGPTRRILVPVPESLAKAEPPPEANTPEPATRPTDAQLAENTRKDREDRTGGPQDRSATASQPAEARKASPASAPSTRESRDLDNEAIAQAKTPQEEAVERFIREHQAELAKLREHLANEAERKAEGTSQEAAAPASANDTVQRTPPDEPRAASAEKPAPNAKDAAGADSAQAPSPKDPQAASPAGKDAARDAAKDTPKPAPDGDNKAQPANPKTEQGAAQPERGKTQAGDTAAKAGADKSSAEPAKAQDGATGGKKEEEAPAAEGSSDGENKAQVGAPKTAQAAAQPDGGGGRAGETGEKAGAAQSAAEAGAGQAAAEPAKAQDSATGAKKPETGGTQKASSGGEKAEQSEAQVGAQQAGDAGGKQGGASQGQPEQVGQKPDAAGKQGSDGQGQPAEAQAVRKADADGQGKGEDSSERDANDRKPGAGERENGDGEKPGRKLREGPTAAAPAKTDKVSPGTPGSGLGTPVADSDDRQAQSSTLKPQSPSDAQQTDKGDPRGQQTNAEGQGKHAEQEQGEGQGPGKGEEEGQGQYKGQGQGQGKGEDEGQGQGQAHAEGQSPMEGQRQGKEQGEGQGKGQGHDKGQAEGQGEGQGQGQAEGQGEGKGQGQGRGEGQVQGKGEGQGQGQGQGQGKGEGQREGQGQGQEQGKGEGKGKGQGQGKGEGQGVAQGQRSGEGKGIGSGSHPGYGPGGGASAKSNQPDNSPVAPEPQPPPPEPRGRLETIGDVLPVIDALEERLRNRQVDPKLLDALGWDETRANDFVRQFRRAERQAMEPADSSAGPTDRFETTTRPSVAVERSDGSGADAAMLSARNVRASDRTNQLFEVGRQKISDEYRDYLKAYYESLAKDRPATQPAP